MNTLNPVALEALEREVEAEAREYGRRRLQDRLLPLADTHGEAPRRGDA